MIAQGAFAGKRAKLVVLVLLAVSCGSACGTDSQQPPTETYTTSLPASTAPSSPTASMSPTEKKVTPGTSNSFSPTVKAPTPYSPTPCLPFCD